MKVVQTYIRNDSTKYDYTKIHVEDGFPMMEGIEKVCRWIVDEGAKDGNTHNIPDDIWCEAENLLILNEQAWKRL